MQCSLGPTQAPRDAPLIGGYEPTFAREVERKLPIQMVLVDEKLMRRNVKTGRSVLTERFEAASLATSDRKSAERDEPATGDPFGGWPVPTLNPCSAEADTHENARMRVKDGEETAAWRVLGETSGDIADLVRQMTDGWFAAPRSEVGLQYPQPVDTFDVADPAQVHASASGDLHLDDQCPVSVKAVDIVMLMIG